MTADSATSGSDARSVEDAFLDAVFSAVAGKSTAISSTVFRKAVASSASLSRDLGGGARCLADLAFQQTVCQSPASRKLLRRHFPTILHALASHAPHVCALEVAMGLLHPATALMYSDRSLLDQEDYKTFSQMYHSPEVQSVMSNQAQSLRELLYRPHFGETCDSRAEFFSLLRELQDNRILPVLPSSTFTKVLDDKEDASLTFRVFLKCFALASMCRISRVSSCTASQLSKQILASMMSLRGYFDRSADLSDVSISSSSSKSQCRTSSSDKSRGGTQIQDLQTSRHLGSAVSSNLKKRRSNSRQPGLPASAAWTRPSRQMMFNGPSGAIGALSLPGRGGMDEHVHGGPDEHISYHFQPSPDSSRSLKQRRTSMHLSSSGLSVWEVSTQNREERVGVVGRSKIPILLRLATWVLGVGIAVIMCFVALDMCGLLDGLPYHRDVFDDMMI
jgi:hypothetical protein